MNADIIKKMKDEDALLTVSITRKNWRTLHNLLESEILHREPSSEKNDELLSILQKLDEGSAKSLGLKERPNE